MRAAADEGENALLFHPSELEPTLIDAPRKTSQQTHETPNRFGIMEQVSEFRQTAEAMTDRDELNSIFERTRDVAGRYPEDADVQSIFRDVERTVATRGTASIPQNEKDGGIFQQIRSALAGIYANLLTLLSPPRVFWVAGGVLAALLVAFAARHFSQKVPVATIPVHIRTTPEGGTIRVDNKGSGISDLALHLEPGIYHVEASLPGYEPLNTSITVRAGAVAEFPLRLSPMTQPLRVTTSDFPTGQVSLDENPVGSLEGGSLLLPSVAAGQHVLKISSTESTAQEATINFQSTSGAMPVVMAPLESNQLQAVVVSTQPGIAHITSTLGPVAVFVDDRTVGQLGADGLKISDLGSGVHTLTLGEGKNLRSMSFNVGATPALDTFVYSDREVGSIVISVNEDNADVFLDGHRYQRRTQSGGLIIPDLPTAPHTIRVGKAGFSTSDIKKVTVAKGQEAKINFVLVPLSKPAALAIDHMAPGTQIIVDNVFIGAVGPNGTFSSPYIRPGDHSLVFVAQGHKSGHISRTFPPGETVQLSNPPLPPAEAILQVNVGVNTTVTVMRNADVVRQFTGPQKLTLGEGPYVITARDPNGTETKERIYLAPDAIASFPLTQTKN
jgi:hypothetical protein